MKYIKFAYVDTLYPGEIMQLVEHQIVCRFHERIPATYDASIVTAYDGDEIIATYEGYTTVFQCAGFDLILSDNEEVLNAQFAFDDVSRFQSMKKREFSDCCQKAIYYGVDANGEHYSMEETDQINLQNAYAAVQQGATGYPYHSDGNLCRLHTADEITQIAQAMTNHKIWHTTYCNHLYQVLARQETKDDTMAVYYGQALPDDLEASFDAIINAATGKTDANSATSM